MDTKETFKTYMLQLPLLWLSLAFVFGIALAPRFASLSPALLPALAVGCAIALLVWRRRLAPVARLALLAGTLLAVGVLRYQAATPAFTLSDIAYYNDSGQYVTVRGSLARAPLYRDAYIELWVAASHIEGDRLSANVEGLMVARADLGQQWVYGQGIELTGRLRTPQDTDDFAYSTYLARQGVYSEMPFAAAVPTGQAGGSWAGHLLHSLRARGVSTLHRLYPDPAAGLLAGILLGDETGISPRLKEAFNDTATRHIVAISGFNIGIIAGLVLNLASRRVGVRKAIWIAALSVLGYTILVGAQASVVRAGIMGLVVLGSQLAGRDQHSLNTLAFTAALMALINPLVLWDVGFQLSFTATLGLVVFAAPLQLWANTHLEAHLPTEWAARLKVPLSDYVLLTFAAQIFTLPLLLYYFGRLSLVALPANLLVLPLQPAILILGGLSLLAGTLVPWVGQLFALLAGPLTSLTITIVEWLASPAWAAYDVGSFSLPWVLAYYVLLAALAVPVLRAALLALRIRPAVPALLLSACAIGAWSLAATSASGRLQITLLNVEGEALLLRTPTGRNLLINAGPSAVELSSQLGRHVPSLARELDWVFVLGQRPEQINGLLSGLDELNVSGMAWANQWATADFTSLLTSTQQSGLEPIALVAGQGIDLGGGAVLRVTSVSSRGASVLLSMGSFQAFLPLGMDASQLAWLQEHPIPDLELLLLADGGYRPLNPPEWLDAMNAQVYWLSADGQLDAELQAYFAERVLMPASSLGWLEIETDGHTMWVRSQFDWATALMQP